MSLAVGVVGLMLRGDPLNFFGGQKIGSADFANWVKYGNLIFELIARPKESTNTLVAVCLASDIRCFSHE